MIRFVSGSIVFLSQQIKYTGIGSKHRFDNKLIDDTMRYLRNCLFALFRNIEKIRATESWINIGKYKSVKVNFDRGVECTRLCSHILHRKLKNGVPLFEEYVRKFPGVLQMYNQIFIDLWYNEIKSESNIYIRNWVHKKDCEDYLKVHIKDRIRMVQSIKCQWKYCNNRYYVAQGIEKKLKKCKRCKYSRYCSTRCQKFDWNLGLHKQICNLLCQGII